MASPDFPQPNPKSVQEVSKQATSTKKNRWPKSDSRHWQTRLFRNSYTRAGEKFETADWCVKIGHNGRRETFNLGTPNSEAAAARALKIHRTIVGAGWDAAMTEFKPQAAPKAPKAATVGEWIEAVRTTADFKSATLTTYAQSLRQIVAEIRDIGDQPAVDADGNVKKDRNRRPILQSRFDYKTGGRQAWAAKVDGEPLSALTPVAIQKWKLEYVGRAGSAPDSRRRAENSAATLIRCARSLFSPKARKYASEEWVLPDPLPFAEVELPKKGNTTYQSKIDAAGLIAAARTELAGEPLKIFILGLLAGLRKREIDILMWKQIDFTKGVIRIERTEFFEPKSEDSAGAVDMDEETIALLRDWKKSGTGPFVIHSDRQPRHTSSRTNYRCSVHFTVLYAWLRSKGITAAKPLHELRKELGAILASTAGIYAAQSVLRHAQVSTTAAYYADKKRKITAGLGALLVAPPPNAEFPIIEIHSPAHE